MSSSSESLEGVKTSLKALMCESVSSPLKRDRALDDVVDSIASIEGKLPNAAVKIVFQIVFQMVKVYKGPQFFDEVLSLVSLLFERSGMEAVPIALKELYSVISSFSNRVVSEAAHVILMSYCVAVGSFALSSSPTWIDDAADQWTGLVKCLSVLAVPLSFEKSNRATAALKKLNVFLVKYPTANAALVSACVKDKKKLNIPLLSMLLRTGCSLVTDVFADHTDTVVKYTTEQFLKAKAVFSTLQLNQHTAFVAHLPFEQLVGGIEIASKRQAEIALAHSRVIIENTQSTVAGDVVFGLVKTFTPFCISQKDHIRKQAASCTKALLKLCTTSSIADITSHLVEVYSGKHGKVSQYEVRETVLECICAVVDVPMSSSTKKKVAGATVSSLIALFPKESHAGVRVQLLDTIAAHLQKHKGVLDDAVEFVEKNWDALPCEVAHVALATFKDDNIAALDKVLKTISNTIKNAPKQELQSTGQVKVVTAAYLYFVHAKINTSLLEDISNNENAWSELRGGSVINDRFIQSSSKTDAETLAKLCCLCIEFLYSSEAGADALVWADLLVSLALLHPNASTRKSVCDIVSKSVSMFSKAATLALLAALFSHMTKMGDVEDSDDVNLCLSSSTSAFLNLAKVVCVSGTTLLPEERDQVLLAALPPLHHPQILNFKRKSLLPILAPRMVDDLGAFFVDNMDNIFAWVTNTLTESYLDQHREDEVKMVCNFLIAVAGHENFKDTHSKLIKHALSTLRAPTLLATSPDEVGILYTPEGQVYDTSVLPKEEQLRKNQKDYKDKKWEMEVEKELAKKKGKKKEVKLSKHQKEVIENKLAEEKEIRERMRTLDVDARVATYIINSLVNGCVNRMGEHLPALTTTLLRAVKMSAIACHYSINSFCNLGKVTHNYISPMLQDSVSRCIIRLNGAKMSLDEEWEKEELPAMAQRVVRQLFAVSHHKHQLNDVALTYVFPLFSPTMNMGDVSLSAKEDVMVFLNDHSHLGASSLFPRHKYLSLLVNIVRNQPRIAHQAGVSIIDFCEQMASTCEGNEEEAAENIVRELDTLFDAYYSESVHLRTAVLQALSSLPFHVDTNTITVLFVASHEKEEDVSSLAKDLWDKKGLCLPEDICDQLMEPLTMTLGCIRVASASALGDAVAQTPHVLDSVVSNLISKYHELLIDLSPIKDKFGNIVQEVVDPWKSRAGLALGISAIAPLLDASHACVIFSFLLEFGLIDRSKGARKAMLDAGMNIVDTKGKDFVSEILPIFEDFLSDESRQDISRQGGIILLGSCAAHLDKTDGRIPSITDLLLSTLSIQSQQVQEAVAKCLPPLISATKDRVPELVALLMGTLMDPKIEYGVRRGAAYGLAAVGKGSSVKALKDEGVIDAIVEEVQSKKAEKRESALMALELMSVILGRKFEPYIVKLISHLLNCFGDAKRDVRSAAKDTGKAIMSMLSGHGVKMVLPALIESLDSDSWRTKQGSAQMLGSMAYCAPKQLSSCLPTIVPHLSEVLTDSHSKVQAAGKDALKKISSVIRNPEIKHISSKILKALHDPVENTTECLNTLLHTAFVHVIDAASLALIMPILIRALKERSTGTKKKSAQIIGNMYTLTEGKDLIPYLPEILPGLKVALVDPVPDMRSVTAKALGAMVEGMGEEHFTDLLPWLLETLRSDGSGVDRAGAAQGLAEVVRALGIDRLDAMIDSFIEGTDNSNANVREGHLLLFVFLPITFGDEFSPFVSRIVHPIIRGLTDIQDPVRTAAMRAGQRIIHSFQHECINLMLPELLNNVLHPEWRMRHSSILLLGDVLYLLAGTSGNKSTHTKGEDDSFGTEASRSALIDGLGMDTRNRVLSAVYFSRQDETLQVRNAAMHVWKVIVSHTIRTLREILPSLIPLVLSSLSHEAEFRKNTAARTLGEFVRKLGERVLVDVIPMLEKGLQSEDAGLREGVCIGLVEILRNLSDDQAEMHMPSLLPSVQLALSDENPQVRASAGLTFAGLHDRLGSVVIDKIIPAMLNKMYEDDAASMNILDGLRNIMSAKSKVVLPTLIPHLTEHPINSFNANALAKLVAVAGSSVDHHISHILTALFEEIESTDDVSSMESAIGEIVRNIEERSILEAARVLMTSLESESEKLKVSVCKVIPSLCDGLSEEDDDDDLIGDLFVAVIPLTASTDMTIHHSCFGAMSSLAAAITTSHVDVMYNIKDAIAAVSVDDNGLLPGLCIPRGVDPIMSVYLTALAADNVTVRGDAIVAITELVECSTQELFKPHARKVIGPLIRMFTGQLKIQKHVLFNCLCRLMDRLGKLLQSFAPQLQPICIKSLQDPLRNVRVNAGLLLSRLLPKQREKRIDSVVKTLLKDTQTSDSVAECIYKTLFACINEGLGTAMLPETKSHLADHLEETIAHEDEDVRTAAAEAFGSLIPYLENAETVAKEKIATCELEQIRSWFIDAGRGIALGAMIEYHGVKALELCGEETVVEHLNAMLASPQEEVLFATGYTVATIVRLASESNNSELMSTVADVLDTLLVGKDKDIVPTILGRMERQSKLVNPRSTDLLSKIVPVILNCCRVNTSVAKSRGVRILLQLLDMNTMGGDAAINAFEEVAKEEDVEELKRFYKKSMHSHVGERVSPEAKYYMGSANFDYE
eukprot:m.234320 g.234320  ORF g.234320 m.234320 type:complete len:2626 (-) comp13915_c0_seq1:2636-10513(-)